MISYCNQSNCVHGAEYRVKTTGKLLCKHCKNLLDKDEYETLSSRQRQPRLEPPLPEAVQPDSA
jgi:hypothetical protein